MDETRESPPFQYIGPHPHLSKHTKKLSEPFRAAVLATPPKFVSILGKISPTVQIFLEIVRTVYFGREVRHRGLIIP
jgi:hypothetical protein